MMTVYKIAKWETVYTRAESRKLKELSWVAMPTKLTSNGYMSLLDEFEERASSLYGCWCALVAVAASCAVRGVLGTSRGKPLKTSHLSRMTGFQSADFDQLIAWAASSEIGWLEPLGDDEVVRLFAGDQQNAEENDISGESPDDPPAIQENPPTTATGHNRTLQDTTEQHTTKQNNQPAAAKRAANAADGFLDGLKPAELDLSVVGEQALKLFKALGKRQISSISNEFIWESACISELLRPGFLSEVATKVITKDIAKPQPYIEKALRDEAAQRHIDLHQLRKQLPPKPHPPQTPSRGVVDHA